MSARSDEARWRPRTPAVAEPHDVRGHFPYHEYPHPDDHSHAVAEPLTPREERVWRAERVGQAPGAWYSPESVDRLWATLDAAVEERDRLRAALLHSAEEAHIYGPDHDRRPIFECSYEPCRKARAALHHEAGT